MMITSKELKTTIHSYFRETTSASQMNHDSIYEISSSLVKNSYRGYSDFFNKNIESINASFEGTPLYKTHSVELQDAYSAVLSEMHEYILNTPVKLTEREYQKLETVIKTTIAELFFRGIPTPTPIRNQLGDVGLAWQTKNKYLAIEFDSDGDAVFGFSDNGRISSGTLITDGNNLTEKIDHIKELSAY